MGSEKLKLRRDTKENLISKPPVMGEFVFSTDTREIGWLNPEFGFLWRTIGHGIVVETEPWNLGTIEVVDNNGTNIYISDVFGELTNGTQCVMLPGENTVANVEEEYTLIDYTQIVVFHDGVETKLFTRDYPGQNNYGYVNTNNNTWSMIFNRNVFDVNIADPDSISSVKEKTGGDYLGLIAFMNKSNNPMSGTFNCHNGDGNVVSIPFNQNDYKVIGGDFGYIYGYNLEAGGTENQEVASRIPLADRDRLGEIINSGKVYVNITRESVHGVNTFTFVNGEWKNDSRVILDENSTNKYFQGSIYYVQG